MCDLNKIYILKYWIIKQKKHFKKYNNIFFFILIKLKIINILIINHMKINEIQLVKEIIILWKQLKTTQLFEIIKKE